jgi:hypothetical protein
MTAVNQCTREALIGTPEVWRCQLSPKSRDEKMVSAAPT